MNLTAVAATVSGGGGSTATLNGAESTSCRTPVSTSSALAVEVRGLVGPRPDEGWWRRVEANHGGPLPTSRLGDPLLTAASSFADVRFTYRRLPRQGTSLRLGPGRNRAWSSSSSLSLRADQALLKGTWPKQQRNIPSRAHSYCTATD